MSCKLGEIKFKRSIKELFLENYASLSFYFNKKGMRNFNECENLSKAAKDRRNNFLRRTKATAPPESTDTEAVTSNNLETTTNKFTRRGPSKFKSRKEVEKEGKEVESAGSPSRQPSLVGGALRSERPTRTFVRRRLGGANSTTITAASTAPPTTTASSTRRPFRVSSRRRPLPSSVRSSSTSTSIPTTAGLTSEESLQEIEDTDVIEDPTLKPRNPSLKKTVKIQRRPLVSLKEELGDQNPSATNEDERKRQSKKYSASFKQNQLDEVLRQRAKSQEEADETTESKTTAIEDFTAENAVAIAVHQLLSAPVPSSSFIDDESKKSYLQTTEEYTKADTEPYKDTKKTIYFDDFTSTPVYKSSSPDYVATGAIYTGYSTEFDAPKVTTTAVNIPKSTFRTSTYPVKDVRLLPLPTPTITSSGLSGVSPTNAIFSREPLRDITVPRVAVTSPSVSPVLSSTPRFVASRKKLIAVPVEDFSYSTNGYTSANQEPSYFTREYLLESPVTKTYDDEYQYLSPATTPQTTTRKPTRRKLVNRKISTTIRPTTPTYFPPSTSAKPRRVPSKTPKPFEKINAAPKKTYRPIENYDYYDDSDEKFAEKYSEGAKVVLHGKDTIECLDVGNFPHPTSCKKFISCARIDSGAIIGWEYICPKGLSFDPVGGICNWSAGLGCDEKDV